MLVLTRKTNQDIVIGDNVRITVLKVKGNTVRLGVKAPRHVRVVRGELPMNQTPEEPITAEITVVFDEESASSIRSEPNQEKKNDSPESKSRLQIGSTDNDPVSSIRFQDKLPAPLRHNRLKQIAREISSASG